MSVNVIKPILEQIFKKEKSDKMYSGEDILKILD